MRESHAEAGARPGDYPDPEPPITDDDLVEGFASPGDACQDILRGSISVSQLYNLLRAGVVASVRVGRKRLIPVRRLKRDLASGRLAHWRGGDA